MGLGYKSIKFGSESELQFPEEIFLQVYIFHDEKLYTPTMNNVLKVIIVNDIKSNIEHK